MEVRKDSEEDPGSQARSISTTNWPRNVLISCLFIEVWLIVLHFHVALHPKPTVRVLGQALDFTRESSLPTFFGSLLAFAISVAAFLVSRFQEQKTGVTLRKVAWMGLAGLFLIIAIDDSIAMHERIGSITSLKFMEDIHYPSYPWHVTIAPFLALGLLSIVLMIWRDIQSVKGLVPMLLVSLGCYAAAIGMDFMEGIEQMGSSHLEPDMIKDDMLPILMLTEEVIEIAATVVFLYVVLSYLLHLLNDRELPRLRFSP